MVVFVYGRKSKVMAKPFPSQHNHSTHFNSAKTCRMSQDIVKASESFQEFCTENSIWISFSLSLSLFVGSISEVLNFHRFWHMTSISGSIQKTTNASPGTHPMANRKSQRRYALVFFAKRNQPGWSSTRGFWQKDPVVIFFFKGMCEKDQANLKIYSKSTPKMPDFKGQ